MKTATSVEHLKFIKTEDSVHFYEYKILFSDGSMLEGDDFITVLEDETEVKESLIGIVNDYYHDKLELLTEIGEGEQ